MQFSEELLTLKDQVRFDKSFKVGKYDKIVIAGMGGSGIAGRIFSEIYDEKPVFLVDDYDIPSFVDDKTEFIAISYSGNTEETISASEEAAKKHANVHAITSGGSLSKMGFDTIIIPSGLQPRSSIGYLLMPLVNTFIKPKIGDVDEAYRLLSETDKDNEEEKSIASEIYNGEHIPVIYGSRPFRAIAYRWKTQFNENAKVLAYSNYFSELNHNDTMPLKDTYRKDEFYFLVFRSDDSRFSKRITVTEKITGNSFRMVDVRGSSLLAKLFYLIHFGDYLTYHLAELRGVDPQDVSLIEKLKKEIA
ncbi:hypothetical protein [Thermoplasma volcanium GSS1]|uniref:Bifunctional phosphoglucose/phosphomannose isomerase n=1 Tax=Thermoplasma volcanium (strain ATCC 51530 / DSM 4299 / JCM 9571 / NBRC 15438 / GSS1) TaxID=273116 RepID=PGMI_THEVO|nr:bifunctional phosphoglucose/phosphomannose isomerase [Thermoplasma volcanium]Q978F3.1 RecName: Full=Bifunctional phosphoglucose/phosphomannose isomerase; AltName: Full=Glucose-6-phosphate isomerase; Short=GPI; AltName: Full=Mannose-6-phosphate isomerase; AltName: Full=Phosphoglucose isomerase; Short=PGI; AltName: Full=Phosphomannose isomerase; Short=PMI [Thermoplasma volcanium GSS1]BAB60606.1 hypothetical protein [Thermoplasma volcanium GSS1]